ncbi:MAG: SpoIIE family protein phosphatase [Planctomycetes bacterium]|nr:SpoIIE family protein phosphatase [Planctomycetota bacterium]
MPSPDARHTLSDAMAEQHATIDQLRRILDVTRRMAATTDLDVLLSMIVDAACQVLECQRATIFLYDQASNELVSRVAKDAREIRFPADRGIAGAVAQGRKLINVPDAYADERFNPDVDRKTGFRTRNLLTLPLENIEGRLTGVLQVLNKRGGPFDRNDEDLAGVFGAQAGVALHRGKLLEEYAEKQRLARDMDIARTIQRGLLPKENPTVPGYEIAGWNRSADETGGDCYDFIPLRDGRLAILLADATGHGIGAALVIAQCRSLVRAMLSVSEDLLRIAASVNSLLAHDLSEEHFVTAFVGILDPARHTIEYVAGGQGPLLLVTRDSVDNRTASDLPFAVLADHEFTDKSSFQLERGAIVVLLTDGFFETADQQQAFYGEDRVAEFVQAHLSDPLETLIERLHDSVREFRGALPQADDLTAVLIRRTE